MPDETTQASNIFDHLQPCDLVMQGAITSGIVYPPAINEMRKTYYFRGIGGTSAGAVAAAGAAAAEFNRENGGFERLTRLTADLADDVSTTDKRTKLRNLFQASQDPSVNTQPLLDILDATLHTFSPKESNKAFPTTQSTQPTNGLLRLIQSIMPAIPNNAFLIADQLFTIWSQAKIPYKPFKEGARIGWLVGGIAGITLAAIPCLIVLLWLSFTMPLNNIGYWSLLGSFLVSAVLFGLAAGWPGSVISRIAAIVVDLLDLSLNRLPNNYYGICTGHTVTKDGQSDNTNLTDWLYSTLQNIAGKDAKDPFTFKDLETRTIKFNGVEKTRRIELQFVTSNLSQGIPYLLPCGLRGYLFKKEDMDKLFPPDVVQHLIKCALTKGEKVLIPPESLPKESPSNGGGQKYYYLPDGLDLPVVFGARLSLSFPLLLSAVPLYTISTDAYRKWSQLPPDEQKTFVLDEERDLQTNWFSDGGICSNFPIQFFDSWLPSWPTFGMYLTPSQPETSAFPRNKEEQSLNGNSNASNDPQKLLSPHLPQPNDTQDPIWHRFTGLQDFLWFAILTAQSHRDTLQVNLPSYRERIVQVPLAPDEGGLDLSMPASTIKQIISRGVDAGNIFDPEKKNFDFNYHWWVRFLVLMGLLAQNFRDVQQFPVIPVPPGTPNPGVEARLQLQLEALKNNTPYPYPRAQSWYNQTKDPIKSLLTLVSIWAHDQDWYTQQQSLIKSLLTLVNIWAHDQDWYDQQQSPSKNLLALVNAWTSDPHRYDPKQDTIQNLITLLNTWTKQQQPYDQSQSPIHNLVALLNSWDTDSLSFEPPQSSNASSSSHTPQAPKTPECLSCDTLFAAQDAPIDHLGALAFLSNAPTPGTVLRVISEQD